VRATFLVVLLVFAVALTTALVLAGERNSGGARKKAQHVVPRNSICVQLKAESSEWNIA
jgi:predicted kinase